MSGRKLVEAFGSSNYHSLHVWQDGGSIRVGIPSYDAQRGGAFVAFAGEKDAQVVLELAEALTKWALESGAQPARWEHAPSPALEAKDPRPPVGSSWKNSIGRGLVVIGHGDGANWSARHDGGTVSTQSATAAELALWGWMRREDPAAVPPHAPGGG